MQPTPAPRDALDNAHPLLPARADGRTTTTPLSPRPTPATAAPAMTRPPIVARVGITVRDATLADVAFIDTLQKAHSRELGFLPTMAIEGKIKLGQVLVAEGSGQVAVGSGREKQEGNAAWSSLPTATCPLPTPLPVGYLIAADRYFKRDEIGYVTQIGVLPEYRRHLVAAQLLQAQFDRSAYGCRLYSCWCAQDLKANEFWEAMGFTAIAFRTGSRTKGKKSGQAAVGGGQGREEETPASSLPTAHRTRPTRSSARIHLFWQKRIRPGDTTTPWWYPAQTGGGELREDRLVFPIPSGMHWRDVLPVVLPEDCVVADGESVNRRVVEEDASVPSSRLADSPPRRQASKTPKPTKPAPAPSALWFGGSPKPAVMTDDERAARAEAKAAAKEEARLARREAVKIDPRLTAMARELRDRWSEQADTLLALPGKHDVKRAMLGTAAEQKMLAA